MWLKIACETITLLILGEQGGAIVNSNITSMRGDLTSPLIFFMQS